MVFTTIPALTDTIMLDAFVARLATHSVVDGILLMGSTGSGKLTATSDYDVLLILADDRAAPPLVVTWVDNHLTEVLHANLRTCTHCRRTYHVVRRKQ